MALFLAEILLINFPAYMLVVLLFDINPPASLAAAIGFVASLVGAFLLAATLNYLVSLIAFWTFGLLGVLYAQKALMDILAGTIIPLSLFPDWLRTIALALPFQGMAHVPLSIYIGTIEGADVWVEIFKQWAWVAGMLVFIRLIWIRASKMIVIQGG